MIASQGRRNTIRNDVSSVSHLKTIPAAIQCPVRNANDPNLQHANGLRRGGSGPHPFVRRTIDRPQPRSYSPFTSATSFSIDFFASPKSMDVRG
jgi:hypothetical protein